MFFLILHTLAFAPPFELQDGDRVVWIGSAIVEREQKYGYWETALLCQWPDRKFTFRNLGWSGDTVEGIARASFDPPAKGYERLIASVKAQKPTVIFVSYGSVEALEEKADVAKFQTNLEKLVTDLSDTKARFVLFSPMPMEDETIEGGTTRPSPIMERNLRLNLLARTISEVSVRGGHHYADLNYKLKFQPKRSGYTFTDNGLHLSEAGYEATIPDFLATLGVITKHNPAKFEAVRKAVVKKNELFFNQWRPQNETYLFGFRKHEQGNNAGEVKEFEKLIDAAEAEIAMKLKDIK